MVSWYDMLPPVWVVFGLLSKLKNVGLFDYTLITNLMH